MKRSEKKDQDDMHKIAVMRLKTKIKKSIKSSGVISIERVMQFIHATDSPSLPSPWLDKTDTIEIYQQCITDYKNKLKNGITKQLERPAGD